MTFTKVEDSGISLKDARLKQRYYQGLGEPVNPSPFIFLRGGNSSGLNESSKRDSERDSSGQNLETIIAELACLGEGYQEAVKDGILRQIKLQAQLPQNYVSLNIDSNSSFDRLTHIYLRKKEEISTRLIQSESLINFLMQYQPSIKINSNISTFISDKKLPFYSIINSLTIFPKEISEISRINSLSPMYFELLGNSPNQTMFIPNKEEDIVGVLDRLTNEGHLVQPMQKRDSMPQPGMLVPNSASDITPLRVATDGMPARYMPLYLMLSQRLPFLWFDSVRTLRDTSQHNVDILVFKYLEFGQERQFLVAAKDKTAKEQKISQFFQAIGVNTYAIYDGERLFMQYVGTRDLRDQVLHDSEPSWRRGCAMALRQLGRMHVRATQHLRMLKEDYGLSLEVSDYNRMFYERFMVPVAGGIAYTPQMQKLRHAYAAFCRIFDPKYFVHGDGHDGNFRIGDSCFAIDTEWARIGTWMDDTSRLINGVIAEKQGIVAAEFIGESMHVYIVGHNEEALEIGMPLINYGSRTDAKARYSIVNDIMYKVGEHLAFAELHPAVREAKIQEGVGAFRQAIDMLDNVIQIAEKQLWKKDYHVLCNLREAMVDFVSISPYEDLRKVAGTYRKDSNLRQYFMAEQITQPAYSAEFASARL